MLAEKAEEELAKFIDGEVDDIVESGSSKKNESSAMSDIEMQLQAVQKPGHGRGSR